VTYDIATLLVRVAAFVVAVAYAIKVTRGHHERRSVTSSIVVIGSGALVYGGLQPFGLVDAAVSRVLYTGVAVSIFIACLTLLTVDE